MFVGQYQHQIDEKGRIRIPSRFKEGLGENPYIFCGTDNCLFVYSKEEADRVLFNRLGDDSFADEKNNKIRRLISAHGMIAEEDKQGRILLTPKLLKHAQVQKNIVSIGVLNRIEIWSEERWNAYNAENDVDDCFKLLAQGGGPAKADKS